MGGMEPNYFTINGKAFPATETINVKKGQLVRLRLVGTGQFIHPMHLHGLPFKIVATDGHPVPEAAQLTKDTLSVAPGERVPSPGEALPGCAEAGVVEGEGYQDEDRDVKEDED